jgi:hypothetical protein
MHEIIWSPGVTLADAEKSIIHAALKFHRGNKTATANSLGISARTVDNKLAEYAKHQETIDSEPPRNNFILESFLKQKEETRIAILADEAARRPGVQSATKVAAESGVSVRQSGEIQKVLPEQNAEVPPKSGHGDAFNDAAIGKVAGESGVEFDAPVIGDPNGFSAESKGADLYGSGNDGVNPSTEQGDADDTAPAKARGGKRR